MMTAVETTFAIEKMVDPEVGNQEASGESWCFRLRTLHRSFRRSVVESFLRILRGAAPSPAGFTLIEVLITLVILSTGIIVVLRAFETSLSALGESRDSLRATMLIKERMIEVESAACRDGDIRQDNGSFDGAFSDYEYEMDAVPCERVGSNILHKVKVSVWRKDFGRTSSVSTYVRTTAE